MTMASTLNNDELLALRAFHRQVDRLRQCSIVKQGKVKLSSRTNFDMVSGEVITSFTGYDPELFQAALPIKRQFVLNDEISFNRMHNVVNQRCDRPELVGWCRYAKRKWDAKLASLPDEVHRHLHVAPPTVDEALEKVFYGYGGLFHVDIKAPQEEEGMRAIEHGMLHHAFPHLCWCLNVIDSVIYWWLDATKAKVPPVPTK